MTTVRRRRACSRDGSDMKDGTTTMHRSFDKPVIAPGCLSDVLPLEGAV